jgi:hypothetical protein
MQATFGNYPELNVSFPFLSPLPDPLMEFNRPMIEAYLA